MWRLVRAQVRHRWLLRLMLALLAGTGAAAVEWFYEGRSPGEWLIPVPLALLVGAVSTSLLATIESNEQRPVLLKSLPISTAAIALANVIAPAVLYLPVVVLSLGLGAALGVVDEFVEFRAALVWAALWWSVLAMGPFWSELKPRFVQWPYGKLLHYGLPFLGGGVFGGYLSNNIDRQLNETLTEAAVRWMSPALGLGAVAAGVLLSLAAVLLFVRRDSFVT